MKTILEVKNLSKSFADTQVLTNIKFQVVMAFSRSIKAKEIKSPSISKGQQRLKSVVENENKITSYLIATRKGKS